MTHVYRLAMSAALLFCALAIPRTSAASGTPRWSPEQLAAFADIVVIARVDELVPGWDPDTNAIYTYVHLSVDRVLKGVVPQPQIVVKQLGGRVGGVGLHVADQAAFTVGETALLFLEVRPRDGTLYTSALWQGKWSVESDAVGRPMLLRREPDHGDGGRIDRASVNAIERSVARAPRGRQRDDIAFVPLGHELAPAGVAVASTYAFTLLGPLRYLFSPAVDMQAGGQPGLPGGGVQEILSAIGKWNNAGATFRYGLGTADVRPRCTTEELGNGRVTITFMDPCSEMSNEGGTLAIGGSYYFTGGAGSVDGTEFNRASEGFIVTNDGPTALQYLTTAGCFEDVQTHELGHVLGLGHSLDPNAIMFPTINAGCAAGARSLGTDDVAGIGYIYGFRVSGLATAPTLAPAVVQVTVNGATSVVVSWTPVEALSNVDVLAATSYRIDFRQGHQDGGPVLASFTTTSTSITVAIPPGLTGSFNVVVTPINADGGGPPSFRRDFVICGTLPGAIAGLTGSVGNGIARASWMPSPGATSYQVTVGSVQGAADVYAPVDLGNATSAQAAVGPGFRAWLRLVAINACGTSAPADLFLSEP